VARRPVPTQARYTPVDEVGMELAGFLGFLDPPKESAAPALQALRDAGVRPVILTGDNEQVTARVCAQVGVPVAGLLTGAQVEALDDARLAAAAEGTAVFARLTPGHKERIIRALQARGHVVGFLGDGINDAPALHTADVGISVDSAVDIAKDAADVILLDKDLRVLEDGVRQGRTTFANILKYVRMGASSNFGNMLSVVGASAWLPFLPMAPIQVLTNNLLYDLSQLPIPGDRVDPDQLAKPRPWSLPALRRYILVFGPLSSLFDYATFAALFFLFGFDAPAHRAAFQTGWFVESLCTQALVIHVIRTERIPFLQSRPSAGVLAASVAVVAIGVWLPASPLGPSLGFVPLPAGYWPLLAAIVLGYLVLTQLAKGWLRRRALL
jgi:Mg2+-importing ATPase